MTFIEALRRFASMHRAASGTCRTSSCQRRSGDMTSSAELYSLVQRSAAPSSPAAPAASVGSRTVAALDSAVRLLLADHDLVDFLARTDAGDFTRFRSPISAAAISTTRADGARGTYVSPGMPVVHGREDRVDGVVQAEQEAGHLLGRDRHRPAAADLVVKQRDHRTARRQHVAVAHADEPRARAAHVAWMKMRSWIALVMPIALTGLHALSVETPTTVSIGRRCSWMARTMFSGPSMLVCTASYGKVFARRHLLQGGGVTTMSASRRAARNAVRSRARRRCGTRAASRSCGR